MPEVCIRTAAFRFRYLPPSSFPPPPSQGPSPDRPARGGGGDARFPPKAGPLRPTAGGGTVRPVSHSVGLLIAPSGPPPEPATGKTDPGRHLAEGRAANRSNGSRPSPPPHGCPGAWPAPPVRSGTQRCAPSSPWGRAPAMAELGARLRCCRSLCGRSLLLLTCLFAPFLGQPGAGPAARAPYAGKAARDGVGSGQALQREAGSYEPS